MIHPLVMAAMANGGPVFAITAGASVSGTTSHEHGIIVRTDGTIDKYENGSFTKIADWIVPNDAADTTYEFRITSVSWTSGSAFSTEAAAEDVWIAVSADLAWYAQDVSSGAPGVQTVSFTLEGRPGSSGSATTSAGMSINADYEL